MSETPKYYYPNRMGRVVFQSTEQVIGPDRFNTLITSTDNPDLFRLPPANLNKQVPFEAISALQAAIEAAFGIPAGRNINLQAGRQCLDKGLKQFDPILGIADLPLRLMPVGMKFRVGLDVFARLFNTYSDQVVTIRSTPTHMLWIIERCPLCWGRKTDAPCCQLAQGLLEESIFWGTGGRRYHIEEVECIGMGDPACVFQIDKQPLD
jgi:hypothetical protein